MKKIALLMLFFFLFSGASAVQMTSYDLTATIDGTSVREDLLVFVDYKGETSIEIMLTPGVRNFRASINDAPVFDCKLEEVFGATKVSCPVSVKGDYFFKASFDTTFPIVSLDDKMLFSQDVTFGTAAEKFAFRIKLPERAVLPEPADKFVSPEPARIYSDGRRIILSYESQNVTEFDASIIYEPPSETPNLQLVAFFVGLLAAAVLLFALKSKTKKKPKAEKPVKVIEEKKVKAEKPISHEGEEKLYLLPDEKAIVHILKQEGKPIRQKDIEKQVMFSKAKLSRVLRNLEERGIIKRVPRGNTNLVELVQK